VLHTRSHILGAIHTATDGYVGSEEQLRNLLPAEVRKKISEAVLKARQLDAEAQITLNKGRVKYRGLRKMQINTDLMFRILFVMATVAMMLIRVYYQKKVLPKRKQESIKGNPLALIPGAIAALTAIVFGLEYIIAPGTFRFAYIVDFPQWLRWIGFFMLGSGILLLRAAHHHLGLSFSSFVALKEEQALVETGPYRTIRHPIYTAYFINYLGGGLLAGNIILTAVPTACFVLMVAFRIHEEEAMLMEAYGERYKAYMGRTGRFLPFF
jgi:protein-S-isoprenylcysteine O-methyltransferase Ste14